MFIYLAPQAGFRAVVYITAPPQAGFETLFTYLAHQQGFRVIVYIPGPPGGV